MQIYGLRWQVPATVTQFNTSRLSGHVLWWRLFWKLIQISTTQNRLFQCFCPRLRCNPWQHFHTSVFGNSSVTPREQESVALKSSRSLWVSPGGCGSASPRRTWQRRTPESWLAAGWRESWALRRGCCCICCSRARCGCWWASRCSGGEVYAQLWPLDLPRSPWSGWARKPGPPASSGVLAIARRPSWSRGGRFYCDWLQGLPSPLREGASCVCSRGNAASSTGHSTARGDGGLRCCGSIQMGWCLTWEKWAQSRTVRTGNEQSCFLETTRLVLAKPPSGDSKAARRRL